MSDFLDNLSKAVNEAACKAVKASGNAVELTKTSVNIKLDELKRENFFKEIGKLIYESYKADPSCTCCVDVLDFCKCIDEIEAAIDEKKIKAAKLKNKKYCVNCGMLLDKIASYCYSCGAKQPIIVEESCDCGCEPEPCGCDCGCEEEPCDCGCEAEACDCEPCDEQEENCCEGGSCEIK